METTAFLGIGSNLGDREKYCKRALSLLTEHPHIAIDRVSKWYETKALTLVGETHPNFLNGAAQIKTDLSPNELAKTIKTIEYELGRKPSEKWQPRVIDLDILFYQDRTIDTPRLKIPHPELHKRRFVLEPLHEIAPDWIHPILQKSVAQLLQDVLAKS